MTFFNIYRNNLGDNVSDISPTGSLSDFWSGSGEEYAPSKNDIDSDDSLQNIDNILPLSDLANIYLSDSVV